MLHYKCLTSYIPYTSSESLSKMTELFLVHKNLPSLSPAYVVTSAAAELTYALYNPTPSIPIPYLGEKQTTALIQLASIFNMAVPQAPAPPPAQLPMVETPGPPQQRTQQPATAVPLEPSTRQREKVKDKVTITPWRAPWKPTQKKSHVIPDDTKARSPLTKPYNGNSYNIPLVQRYNTISRRMQGHELMANHIATFQPLNPPNIAVPTYSFQKTVEDWEQINKTTGDMKIHPGQMNALICP